MAERNFMNLVVDRWSNSLLCVGLDSNYEKIPKFIQHGQYVGGAIFEFNQHIIDAVADLVCAFKINSAFYEMHLSDGLTALLRTISYIHEHYPEVPVILDAKRADIGNSNAAYVTAVFDELQADAVTVHPYFGKEAMWPFLERRNKGIIVLCRTSNPGGGEFQDDRVNGVYGPPLYLVIAKQVATYWNTNENCALVVGATYPGELGQVRKAVGDLPLLVPGIGHQGGNVQASVEAGMDSRGAGMIINSSRGVIFASGGTDFVAAARREALRLRDLINSYR